MVIRGIKLLISECMEKGCWFLEVSSFDSHFKNKCLCFSHECFRVCVCLVCKEGTYSFGRLTFVDNLVSILTNLPAKLGDYVKLTFHYHE